MKAFEQLLLALASAETDADRQRVHGQMLRELEGASDEDIAAYDYITGLLEGPPPQLQPAACRALDFAAVSTVDDYVAACRRWHANAPSCNEAQRMAHGLLRERAYERVLAGNPENRRRISEALGSRIP